MEHKINCELPKIHNGTCGYYGDLPMSYYEDRAKKDFLPQHKRRQTKKEILMIIGLTIAVLGSMYLENYFMNL